MNDQFIVHFISKTKKKMIRFIEKKLPEYDLGDIIPTHGNILTALYESADKLTMKEIARRIGKDKSTVTPLVNKLVTLGYVRKEKCDKDKRITHITLTAKGREIEPTYNKISEQVRTTAYRGFTQEEKETFLKLLKRMNNNFNVEDLEFNSKDVRSV